MPAPQSEPPVRRSSTKAGSPWRSSGRPGRNSVTPEAIRPERGSTAHPVRVPRSSARIVRDGGGVTAGEPPRSFLTVTDTAIRWQVPALDIAGWAIDGEIALSAVLPTVETTDKQIASGIVEIDGADVVALFRRDGASRKPALVRRFRRSKKSDWEWIARPVDGVAVAATDVIILRKEFERCERAWGLFDAIGAEDVTKSTSSAKRQAGPGAPPKHDWDAFAGAIARRVHDHGMPVSQGELVRDMMDWFAGREDFPPPDERTVRRKVSAIWKELSAG